MPLLEEPEHPPADDLDAWRELIAAHDQAIGAMMSERTASAPVTTAEQIVGGAPVYEITPIGVTDDDRHVYLEIHGGAFVFGRGEHARAMGIGTRAASARAVVAVDYRMPPDHPFPAGLDDCLAVYRALLLDRPAGQIVVGGASAGGNLAAALVLRAPMKVFRCRPPSCCSRRSSTSPSPVIRSHTNLGLDPLIPRRASTAFQLYAGDRELTDPYVSPLFGDFTAGFPPTILTTGTRDMLLSDTVRMHRALRAAGIPATLHVTEAGGHGGFFGMAPEDREIDREIRSFVGRPIGWSRIDRRLRPTVGVASRPLAPR